MCSPVAQKSLRDAVSSPEVPPEIEAVLCLYAKHHPEDALGIEKVLGFRKRVRAELDRLVRESERQRPKYQSLSSGNRQANDAGEHLVQGFRMPALII
jgi:hypothetical protein